MMTDDPFTLQKKLEQALALQQNNQLEEASRIFEEILSVFPDQADALHGMGMIFAQQRRYAEAVPYLEKALHFAPYIAEFHNNLGNAYKAVSKPEKALQHYREALRLKSPYPEAHNNLGTLLYRIGRYDEAIMEFQKALRMNPLSVDTHYNLANSYIQQDRLLEAVPHFQEVLKQRPEHLGSLHNLGITLCALKRFEEAKPLLEHVVQRENNNIDALFHLGVIYSSLAQGDLAKESYLKVLALDPNYANAHHNLGTIYLHLHQNDLALKHFHEAVKLQPLNKTAKHMINALEGKTSEQGAPLEYTRALFDQYAYSYDKQVKEKLKYQVPYLLRSAIGPYVEVHQSAWKALDLGCGTGLCAPLFSDIVGKLIGVDVSPNMIEVARMQGGYYQLYVVDALHFLQQHPKEFDLIICADVFVYFGSLADVFAGCYAALKSSGLFTFSVEALLPEEITQHPLNTDYQLRQTGRYAHQAAYIQNLAKTFNWTILVEKPAVLRYQENNPVEGYIYVLKK